MLNMREIRICRESISSNLQTLSYHPKHKLANFLSFPKFVSYWSKVFWGPLSPWTQELHQACGWLFSTVQLIPVLDPLSDQREKLGEKKGQVSKCFGTKSEAWLFLNLHCQKLLLQWYVPHDKCLYLKFVSYKIPSIITKEMTLY